MNGCKAVAILIDNSATSMDGDFNLNRLDAQIQTISRYSQHLFDRKNNSQVAIGTLSTQEFGIRVSFTTNFRKVETCCEGITSSGTLDLVKGIKCAVLALHHCKNSNGSESEIDIEQDSKIPFTNEFRGKKRILAFVGSQNNLDSNNYRDLIDILLKEQVGIDLIELGESVPNSEVLAEFISELNKREKPDGVLSTYLPIPKSKTLLSDDVISKLELDQIDDFPNDLDLQEAVKFTQQSSLLTPQDNVLPQKQAQPRVRKPDPTITRTNKKRPAKIKSPVTRIESSPNNFTTQTTIPVQPLQTPPLHSTSPQPAGICQYVYYRYPAPNQSPNTTNPQNMQYSHVVPMYPSFIPPYQFQCQPNRQTQTPTPIQHQFIPVPFNSFNGNCTQQSNNQTQVPNTRKKPRRKKSSDNNSNEDKQ